MIASNRKMAAATGLGRGFEDAPPRPKQPMRKRFHGNELMIAKVEAMVDAACSFYRCPTCLHQWSISMGRVCPKCSVGMEKRGAAQAKRERKMALRAKQAGEVDTLLLVTLLFIVLVVLVAIIGGRYIFAEQRHCEARGGTHLRTSTGYACVKLELVQP